MTKKEWEEHCKWLDTFRGKTVTKKDGWIKSNTFWNYR
mgnify:CR=1 FL=1